MFNDANFNFLIGNTNLPVLKKIRTESQNGDDYIDWEDCTNDISIDDTILITRIENFLLEHYDFRLNVAINRIEYKDKNATEFLDITDYVENSLFRRLNLAGIKSSKSVLKSILHSDFCTRFDPFVSYLDSLKTWDETHDYMDDLAKTVSTTKNELWLMCLKKWLVAMVASLMDKEVVNQTVIVFSGAQGKGKTTWLENLIPIALKKYIYSGSINPDNKDTLTHLSECILINLDEMENLNRPQLGTLKDIITKKYIRIRRPFAHNSESLPRRASFVGSVNNAQFLNDDTGSRRFLCFEVTEIEYQHKVNMDNVLAQALDMYRSGYQYWFDEDEITIVTANNEQYQKVTMEEELLLADFEPVKEKDFNNPDVMFLTTTQIGEILRIKSNVAISNSFILQLGKALNKHKFIRTKQKGRYAYAIKELKQ